MTRYCILAATVIVVLPSAIALSAPQDTTPPTIVRTVPDFAKPVRLETRELRIVFSEPMGDGIDLTFHHLPVGPCRWEDGATALVLPLAQAMDAGTYRLDLNYVGGHFRDRAGNQLERCTLTFTAGTGAEPNRLPAPPAPAVEIEVADIRKLDLSADALIHVTAEPDVGFNFPYYLFVSSSLISDAPTHLLVEPCNTGSSTDDFSAHDGQAGILARHGHANRIARALKVPLLVPVFPRPREGQRWRIYTHSLDRDTLLVKEDPLRRIDLQLIAMIDHARRLLATNGIEVYPKVFMHGFSASGTFSNRFAILHPQAVRAVASGGVNGIPTFPVGQWKGTRLRYPVGIADLKEIADIDYDEAAYKAVSQYIYMGHLDRNDTIPYRDAYDEEDAVLVKRLVGEAMMPGRWEVSQSVYTELGIPAQFVTYHGTGHTIRSEMLGDIVRFFKANGGDEIVSIEPHQYPFVEFQELTAVHVEGLLWRGDAGIPAQFRDLGDAHGFAIAIEEWIEGRDCHQLGEFRDRAGFDFILKADGQPDVLIGPDNYRGTLVSRSGGDAFQGFVVELTADQLERTRTGVGYAIEPINQDSKYRWRVKDGVRLRRPDGAGLTPSLP